MGYTNYYIDGSFEYKKESFKLVSPSQAGGQGVTIYGNR